MRNPIEIVIFIPRSSAPAAFGFGKGVVLTLFSPDHVEFPQKTPYPRGADAFVRLSCREFPGGGEMSGLTAHFLFGAKSSYQLLAFSSQQTLGSRGIGN